MMNTSLNTEYHRVRGTKVPPPTRYNTSITTTIGTSPICPAASGLYALCGRAFLFLLFALPFVLASCSQGDADIHVIPLTPMHQMYNESANLNQVQMDSISNFCTKFCGYVNQHPKSRQDEYFDPTIQNIRAAAALHGYDVKVTTVTTGVTINDEWGGDIFITY